MRILQIAPVIERSFFLRCLMCGPQLRSSSIIIPRNLVEQTFSNLVSSMKIDLDLSFLFEVFDVWSPIEVFINNNS